MAHLERHPFALYASLVAGLLLTAVVLPRLDAPAVERAPDASEDDARDRGQAPAERVAPSEPLPVDPVYHQIAAATGGDVSLWSPGEFADAEPILSFGGEDLLLAYEDLGLLTGVAQRSHAFAGTRSRWPS